MSLKNQNSKKEYIELDNLSNIEDVMEDNVLSIEFDNTAVAPTNETHEFYSWFDFLNQSKDTSSDTPPAIEEIDITAVESSPELEPIESIMFDFDEEIEEETSEARPMSIAEDEELKKLLNTYIKEQKTQRAKPQRDTPSEYRTQDITQSSLVTPVIITESMAILYTHQGNYAKAIEIYKKLIDKFPEKSVFFASQIEKIKKN